MGVDFRPYSTHSLVGCWYPRDDSGALYGDTAKVQDVLMYSIFGTKQRIKLCKVLKNTDLFVPNSMMNNLEYIITLLPSDEVLVKQTGEGTANYSLENSELEYESIMITSMFSSGKPLVYEHERMFTNTAWPKDDTVQNIDINTCKKSM